MSETGGAPKPAAPPSVLRVAFTGCCPRCGVGRLFTGVLKLRDQCDACGLDLRAVDTGDGMTVPIVMVLGAVLVGLAFWVEFHFSPPLWVHAVLWPIVAVPLAIAMMRPSKAALVALQFRYRASEMGL